MGSTGGASIPEAVEEAAGSVIGGAAICKMGSWLARRALLAASEARREAMNRPSTTASAMTLHMSRPARMASSFPGIT